VSVREIQGFLKVLLEEPLKISRLVNNPEDLDVFGLLDVENEIGFAGETSKSWKQFVTTVAHVWELGKHRQTIEELPNSLVGFQLILLS
jgi:hypothetical protein